MRRTRHTRRRTRHKRKHRRRRTRRHHKRRRTRHRRRRGGNPLQAGQGPSRGGYRENFISPDGAHGGGGKNKPLIFSDFPPGYKDKAARTAIRKMKHKGHKHKKKHRKH